MADILNKIPSWVIAFALLVFVALLGFKIYEGESKINAWGFEINPLSKSPVLGKITDQLPLGTILPFYGEENDINTNNWILCDGRNYPPNSKLVRDANPSIGGAQVPDLRGKFIQGLYVGETLLNEKKSLRSGGTETISVGKHNHEWGSFSNLAWKSFNYSGDSTNIIKWNNGQSKEGKGFYALAIEGNNQNKFYTDKKEAFQERDIRPPYVKLNYIMRIK